MTDAVHMLTDIAALCLSLLTLWISARPASGGKTYGYLRAEILGALLNGLFLWLLVVFIWFEAARRLRNPPPVRGPTVMAIALVGYRVNSFSAWMTSRSSHEGRAGMALRAVFVHVLSDLIGSFGVLCAGAINLFHRMGAADPAVSLLHRRPDCLWVVGAGARGRGHPDGVGAAADRSRSSCVPTFLAVSGTEEVHDLHVWCLTSRQFALSAHAVVTPERRS